MPAVAVTRPALSVPVRPFRTAVPWLALGTVLIAVAHMRWPVWILGLIAPVPLLHALRRAPGWRVRLALAGALLVGFSLAALKIVTGPMSPLVALGFALPIALVHLPPYLLWDGLVRRGRDGLAIAAFAAATAVLEWAQATFTPFTSWGASAYLALDDLPLLQLAALFGLPGIAFVWQLVPATIERAWARGFDAPSRRALALVALLGGAVHLWGALRLAAPIAGPQVRVAAVATDATFGGSPLPDAAELARIEAGLFERSGRAAAAGAELVVWPEAATLVWPDGEDAFRARTHALAARLGVELVVAYIVPRSFEPLRYENKFLWLRADGSEAEEYWKHMPVPGEPAIAGETPARAHDLAFARAAGAICYDYDVPALARAHAALGVGLVALPSSDWAGIDPIHTQMAGVRAIEGGFSILRSTRLGLSAGIDARGRLRTWMTALEPGDGVMLATLPVERVPTLYAAVGDVLVAPLAAVILAGLVALRRPRFRAAPRTAVGAALGSQSSAVS